MKRLFPFALLAIALLSSCGSSNRRTPPPQSSMRYDPVSRSWVPLTTPSVLPGYRPPHSLPPEKASDTAKILQPSSLATPGAPADPGTVPADPEKPGFLKRVGRVATSPLRAVGIGGE